MSTNRQYGKYISLLFMMLFSFGAQILGVVKSSVVAGVFGAGMELDAYNYANSLLSFLFSLITAAIPTIIVPFYVQKNKQRKIIDSFITTLFGLLFILIIALIVIRHPLVEFLSGKEEGFTDLVCRIIVIMAVAQCFCSVNYITEAFFQSQGKYNLPKIVHLFAQIIVVWLLIRCKNLSILQYAWIIANGMLLSCVLDLGFAICFGWRYTPVMTFRDQETVKLLHSFGPVLISSSAYQLSLITDSIISGRLETGKITILAYSSQISTIISTVIVGNLQTYIYPQIIRNFKEGKPQKIFWTQCDALHSIVWLVIAEFVIIGREGVAILFEHGAFSSEAADMVYWCAGIYVIGQQFNIIRDMIYKYFYAKGDTKNPSQNSIVVSVSNVLISLLLWWLIGFYGIILGTVCASALSLAVILYRFNKQFCIEGGVWHILGGCTKNTIAGITVILTMLLVKSCIPIENDWLSVSLWGISTVGIYAEVQRLINKEIFSAFGAI